MIVTCLEETSPGGGAFPALSAARTDSAYSIRRWGGIVAPGGRGPGSRSTITRFFSGVPDGGGIPAGC